MSSYISIPSEMTFLIVDEAVAFKDSLTLILHKMGFKHIFQALDGVTAFNLLKQEKIGFIICERNLRQMTGMELLKEIRETPCFQRVPFMLMAGEVLKDDVVLASEFGVDGYLKKPFTMNDVSNKLSTSMARYFDPASVETLFEEARKIFYAGDYEEASKFYLQLESVLPRSARVQTGYARTCKARGYLDIAEQKLLKAIDFNPLYVHAFHELGMLYLQMDNKEGALNSFDKAITLSPNNPIRYESLCDILLQYHRYIEAETYLNKAVKLELAYPTLYAQLGKALFSQKKSDKAVRYFEKALKDQPDNISFLNSMGICMKEMGKYEEAIGYYNQALKLLPQDIKVLFNKVLCLVSMKLYDRAKKTCFQIIKLDPNYEKAKRKIKEIEDLESCIAA